VRGWLGKPPLWFRQAWNELLIFRQSALIGFAGGPGRLAMILRDQTESFQNPAALFCWQFRAGADDRSVIVALRTFKRVASLYSSAAVNSFSTFIGTRKEND
jgi:hypothetical protein